MAIWSSFFFPHHASVVEPKPISACEILRRPQDYVGKSLVVQGLVTWFEHGAFLDASLTCGGEAFTGIRLRGDISFVSYFAAGGRKGVGAAATVKGKVIMATIRAPSASATPSPALSVSDIRYEKNCARFKIAHRFSKPRRLSVLSVRMGAMSTCPVMLKLIQLYAKAALSHSQLSPRRNKGTAEALARREAAWRRWDQHVAKHGCTWQPEPET